MDNNINNTDPEMKASAEEETLQENSVNETAAEAPTADAEAPVAEAPVAEAPAAKEPERADIKDELCDDIEFTDGGEAPAKESPAEGAEPNPSYMYTPYFSQVPENKPENTGNSALFADYARWNYERQNDFDKKQRKSGSGGSVRTFAIVMTAVFATAIITLIVAMLLGSALYRDDKVVREEIIIGDRTVYVHEDGSVGGKLTIPEVYEKMKPSTVEISVTASNGSGTGTGIIMSEDGYVITNAHVVEGAKKITVTFFDKKTYEADLIGLDELADVALVKIKDTSVKFKPAEFGSSSNLLVGEAVVAIGCPAGYFLTATNGIVSALPTTIEIYEEDGYTEKEMYLLQTSAPLNPGNSGGPLCNLDGQVIGINTLKMIQSADGTPYEGLGFSIPIDEALEIINDIKAGKQTAGGDISKKTMKLGITGSICVKGESDGMGGKYGESGVYVADVSKGSNADGNLKIGDIIVSFEGNTISEFDPFSNHIKEMKDGEKLTLSVYRDGKVIEVVIEMSIHK